MLTKIGPYPVEREIGRGGMGVVYLARDTRLDRPVAIKVLPEHLAHEPERLARLEREARLLAAVTHPNVAHIYGLEQDGARRLLVLEYVEGETLADMLARGPLSLDETLDVCRQVAAALEAAHEAGIIHRDLKPGNIKVTPGGEVKVLDFGLARGPSPSDSNPDLSQSPTMTVAATSAGVVLGTAAYMSPEQARGRAVDRRTDIWSFGCVLYECLTGRQAFAGETVSDMIALILQGEPDWSRLPAKTPERLKALLGRCLEKDSKRRLRDMGDARIELEEVQSASSASRSGAVRVGLTNGRPGAAGALPRSPARLLATAAALLAFGSAMGFAIERIAWPPPPVPAVRFGIAAPPHMLFDGEPNDLAISPDGGTLAMVVADSSGNTSLWVRPLGSFEARPLPGTRNAVFPFWSPDSRQIAYFADNTLYRVEAAGGTPQTVCDAPNPRGGAWGSRGMMLLSFAAGPLMQVRAAGGTPTPATAMAKGETSHRGPCFLPDGEHFIYTTLPPGEGSMYPCVRGALHDLKREPPYGRALSAPVYAAPGHVIFNGRGTLVAQRFDAGRGRLIGDPFPIGPSSQGTVYSATPALSVSRTGVLAWAASGHELRRVVWLDREGRRIGAVDAPLGNWRYGAISNDGTRGALIMESGGRQQLWVIDFARGISQRLDEQAGELGIAAWSPDDKNLAYDIETGGLADIIVRPSDGSAPVRHVPSPTVQFRAVQSWSADGKLLLCQEIGASRNWDLVILPIAGGPVRPYIVTRFAESNADISPDGRWVVYTSDESGANHEYLQSFPDPGARQQVSRDTVLVGGWSSGGREIILYRQDGGIESVPVTLGPTPTLGTPRLLFRQPEDVSFLFPTRDGRRFMAFVAAEKVTPTISIAIDWRATAAP